MLYYTYSMNTQTNIRCSDEERARWNTAAKIEGRTRAGWMRWILNEAATERIESKELSREAALKAHYFGP